MSFALSLNLLLFILRADRMVERRCWYRDHQESLGADAGSGRDPQEQGACRHHAAGRYIRPTQPCIPPGSLNRKPITNTACDDLTISRVNYVREKPCALRNMFRKLDVHLKSTVTLTLS